jgi:hypothetical protein
VDTEESFYPEESSATGSADTMVEQEEISPAPRAARSQQFFKSDLDE